MNLFLSSDADEYIILLINSVSMSKFEKFIKAIDQKEDWIEELCSCYFETENNNKEYYRFETFEGNTYRHTCATLLYNEGNADILIAQKILGHESLSSTEIYTHINDVKLKDIMQNYGVSSLIEKENEKNGK